MALDMVSLSTLTAAVATAGRHTVSLLLDLLVCCKFPCTGLLVLAAALPKSLVG